MKKKGHVLFCVFLLLVSLGALAGCGDKKGAEAAVNAAMSALVSGGGEGIPMLSLDGSTVTGFENEGLARVISGKLTYEIGEVSAKGNAASASLKITAPDTPAILREALDGLDEYSDEAFIEAMSARLGRAHDTVSFYIEVELQRVDGAWRLIPNAELTNAMTGGLLQMYEDTVRQIQNQLMGR